MSSTITKEHVSSEIPSIANSTWAELYSRLIRNYGTISTTFTGTYRATVRPYDHTRAIIHYSNKDPDQSLLTYVIPTNPQQEYPLPVPRVLLKDNLKPAVRGARPVDILKCLTQSKHSRFANSPVVKYQRKNFINKVQLVSDGDLGVCQKCHIRIDFRELERRLADTKDMHNEQIPAGLAQELMTALWLYHERCTSDRLLTYLTVPHNDICKLVEESDLGKEERIASKKKMETIIAKLDRGDGLYIRNNDEDIINNEAHCDSGGEYDAFGLINYCEQQSQDSVLY